MSKNYSKRFITSIFSVFLIFIGIAAIFIRMPASYLASFAERYCHARCKLTSVNGLWWEGAGSLLGRTSEEAAWQSIGQFSLRFFPGQGNLFELRLGEGRAAFNANLDGIHFKLDDFVFPADVIFSFPALNLPTSGWQGALTFSGVTGRRNWAGETSARGKTSWLAASCSLLENYPLGNFESRWEWHSGTGIKAQIAGGTKGNIEFLGKVSSANLSGDIRLEADARSRLERYVRVLGKPGAEQGRYAMEWSAP